MLLSAGWTKGLVYFRDDIPGVVSLSGLREGGTDMVDRSFYPQNLEQVLVGAANWLLLLRTAGK